VDGENIVVAMPFAPETRLDLVAVDDIGRATQAVLAAPERYVGRELDLISDEQTFRQMVDVIGRESGKPALAVQIPLEALARQWPQGVPMMRMLGEGASQGDRATLRDVIGDPTSFVSWVRSNLVPRLCS
jgi:uncharacterized protein YbjT (DUF2867 family)